MTNLDILRWFENPEVPEVYEEDVLICRWCKEMEEECRCIDEWKIID